MESFENLPDPDAAWQSGPQGPDRHPASGKVAIWAPAIGALGSRSPPCLSPRSRPCSLEEQYFKCGIFWDYDAPQRRVSNSEAPVLAGGIPVFLRGSQFSGASELKEGAGEQI